MGNKTKDGATKLMEAQEYLNNGEHDKAQAILKQFIVSEAQTIYRNLISEDEDAEIGGGESEDFLDDIEADSEELEDEETESDNDSESLDDNPEDEDTEDSDSDEDFDYDEDGEQDDHEEDHEDTTERLDDVEARIQELQDEFNEILSQQDGDEDDDLNTEMGLSDEMDFDDEDLDESIQDFTNTNASIDATADKESAAGKRVRVNDPDVFADPDFPDDNGAAPVDYSGSSDESGRPAPDADDYGFDHKKHDAYYDSGKEGLVKGDESDKNSKSVIQTRLSESKRRRGNRKKNNTRRTRSRDQVVKENREKIRKMINESKGPRRSSRKNSKKRGSKKQ